MSPVEDSLLREWNRLSANDDPSAVLGALAHLVKAHSDPVQFLTEKLKSPVSKDRLWAAWLAGDYPGCEEALSELIDDDSEVGEVARDALLELAPEMSAHCPSLAEQKRTNERMDNLHLRQQWEIRELSNEADTLFRAKDYRGFLELIEPFLAGLDEKDRRRAAFARDRI